MNRDIDSQNSHGSDSEPRTKPLIMVVDDDPVVCCVLAGALNRTGFDVEIFHDSVLALESFDNISPDLAVVDWVMPNLDGLSLVDRLKAKSPQLTTILLTGHGEHEVVEQARMSGRVNLVLDKPFNLAHFLKVVAACVQRREPAAPLQPEERAEAGTLTGWLTLDGREAYFEHILDSLIDAVMMIDREGRVVYFNNGARRMFNFRGQANPGLSINDICPVENQLSALFPHFFGSHPPVQEQSLGCFIKGDGSRFNSIYSASFLQAGPGGSAVLLVVKDISHILQTTTEASEPQRLPLTDPLTGLYNRRHFDLRLAEELRRMERYGSPLTLLMIDFDHFKEINAHFGHLAGDQALRKGAEIFGQALRAVDSLFRWGGDEYMALLPETSGEMGMNAARRLRQLIRAPELLAEIAPGLKVTVSIGLASLPWAAGREVSVPAVLAVMDKALSQAKKNGRDRIVRYLDDGDRFAEI